VSSGKRIFGLGLVGALCTSALIAIAILLFGEFDDTTARILATTGLIGFFSLVSLPGGVLLDRGRYAGLAWVVIALAAGGFLLAMTLVWGDEDDETVWRLAGSVAAVAGAFSQTATATSRRRETDTPGIGLLYGLSIGAVFFLAAMIVAAIWEGIEDEGYYRFLGAVAVANVLLVLLQPVSRRLGGAAQPSPREGPTRDTFRLVFTLRGTPAQRAVDEAVKALERGGAKVEDVERLR
jgi:MFS family permease